MKTSILRFILGLKRPSKAANIKLLKERGEELDSLTIREAVVDDIVDLAQLHVTAWNQTYPFVKRTPTFETRAYQWNELFKVKDQTWCCFVVVNSKGELVGFARGKPYTDELKFDGELNKIYLLKTYQRLGLGRRLVAQVVHRFLTQGINSMVLFSEPSNPSIRFYEALKGRRLYAANGAFHGGYGWDNLKDLATSLAEQ